MGFFGGAWGRAGRAEERRRVKRATGMRIADSILGVFLAIGGVDRCAILRVMSPVNILSEEFAQAAAAAGLRAREAALASGHPVVFVDEVGRIVQEFPDGRRFEVRLEADQPRESHVTVLRELSATR